MNQLASLSESARTIALERFRILQPHLEQERFLTKVARDAGIPYRTAQRWVMHYRKYGLIGLTRDEREDSGSRRALSPTLREIVEALALQKPPLPIAALHRRIARIAKERGEPGPNYFVIYRIVRGVAGRFGHAVTRRIESLQPEFRVNPPARIRSVERNVASRSHPSRYNDRPGCR
jgi:putative transposase